MHARRRSQDDRAGGDLHALGHERARGDDGTAANARAVENDGADADQAIVLDHASVQVDRMGDGDAIAQGDRKLAAVAVQHTVVLDVGLAPDADGVYIAAHHGVEPDAGVFPHHDVADHLRAILNKGRGGDLGMPPLKTLQHRYPEWSRLPCEMPRSPPGARWASTWWGWPA